MDPFEMQERKREARRRLRAQREKAGELRGRVVAISLVCFALLWGIVFVQMATGNDPVLGDTSSTVAQRSGGADRHPARANVAEAGASTDSEEPSSGEEELETSEAETVEPEVEPVEEELVEAEPEPVEEEFIEPNRTRPRHHQPIVSSEAHRSFECFGGTATIHVRGADTGERRGGGGRGALAAARRPPPALALPRGERADPPQPRSAQRGAGDPAAAPARRGGGDGRLAQRRPRRRDPARQHRARRLPALAGGTGPFSLAEALSSRPQRAPAQPHPSRLWRSIGVDEGGGTIIRPPGVRIDSGGIAKGLVADLVAATPCANTGPTRSTAAATSASAAAPARSARCGSTTPSAAAPCTS